MSADRSPYPLKPLCTKIAAAIRKTAMTSNQARRSIDIQVRARRSTGTAGAFIVADRAAEMSGARSRSIAEQ